MKYFSNSYAICNNLNNDLDYVSRKRKFNKFKEFKKQKFLNLPDIKNNKTKYLSKSSALLQESEVNSTYSFKSNQSEQECIEYKSKNKIMIGLVLY